MSATSSSETVQAMHCPSCGDGYPVGLAFCPKDGTRLAPGSAPGTGEDARATAPSLVGKVLAERYRIVRKLGEGGMGEVFEAQHVYIDKRFAIKTLRPEVTANPDAVARFHQEARSASTIGHENIVEVDDFGRLPEGGVYLAMEFLEGRSLAERMRESPSLGRAEALSLMKQVCRGLAAAHAKGIIHRDMKPENIFLADKAGGRTVAKILDFGIAKVTNDTSGQRLTQTGAVFGTPYYMSPEQALGKPQDHRSDIYSLGIILYEVFSGKLPFEGESFMGILSQHITVPPRPPSAVAPERQIPAGLERVILKAMAKEAERRHQTVAELLEDLDRVESQAERIPTVMPALAAGEPKLELDRGSRSSPSLQPMELDVEPAPARSRGRGWAIGGVALAAAAAVAFVAMRHPAPTGNTTANANVSNSKDPAGGSVTRAAVSAVMPAVPTVAALPEVVLDTTPPGAQVYAAGQVIGVTPAAIKVKDKLEVLLRKDGYVARQLVLDPAREPRMVVPLHKTNAEHAAPHAPSTKTDHPGTTSPDPGNPILDPYAPLPPPAAKKSPRATPPASAPMNPY